MAGTFTNLVYHIVFSTKDRIPLISGELAERLYEYMGGIIRGEGGTLLEIGGMPDHVHLLARFKADASVATMVGRIKSHSTLWVNEQRRIAGRFQWQAGYGAFSVSESRISAVRTYIRNQPEHHAKVSLRDELIALLKKHGIDFDERYLLG
jgi:REP element-mobilizing transposase RayT